MDSTLKIPCHVAIIMDGNGRWAAEHGHDRLWGHTHGVESVRAVVKESVALGIRYLTIYAFSSENWGRPEEEVSGLMKLLASTISAETLTLAESGVRMKFIGDRDALPENLRKMISDAETVPVEKVRLTLVIALNYGSRHEIVQAVRNIVASGIKAEDITQQTVADNLTTAGIPDPDLLIRTSGEIRLSNFLLWQLSYSELYFTDINWPDFDGKALDEAVEYYSRRNRRWGKLQ